MFPPPPFRRTQPVDQADGLRRLFGNRSRCFIPLVSNPFVTHGGVLIERLCTVLDDLQMTTLLVDASERGSLPRELTGFDLAEGLEPLSDRVSYLAARGLPVRWVDSHGSTHAFLDALAEAVPQAEVILVHASAVELARLFGRGDQGLSRPRPVLLCDDRPDAMTHAYAALKTLAQRADWLSHDLLMCASPHSTKATTVAARLAECAEMFLGGVQHAWVQIDPAEPPTARPAAELGALVEASLQTAAVFTHAETGHGGLRLALPSGRPAMA